MDLERTQLLLIGGERVEAASGATFETINPANGQALTAVAEAGAEDVDRAVRAARAAFEGSWSRFSPYERHLVLLRLADLVEENAQELASRDVLDVGHPIAWAEELSGAAAAMLRWYAAAARSVTGQTIEDPRTGSGFSYTVKQPLGVVGAITPWNVPLTMAVWKLGPVLATGCSVVLKPAELSPLSALRLGELCLEAGVPAGVVNVISGGKEAGASLAAHADVDKIAFTGSVATGQSIIRASAGNIKRLSLELGGKSPAIVFADADMEQAAEGVAMAIFGNSGQVCAAGSRLYVERPIYEEFVSRVAEVGRGLRVGDPLDPSTQLGPLASSGQLDRVLSYLASGREEGARLVSGGARCNGDKLAAGYFIEPTVFADTAAEMRIAKEEIFGPVLSAIAFDSIDEALRAANDSSYGLAAYVWSSDLSKAHRLAARLQSGVVGVNTPDLLDPAIPFGGVKMSGYGRELGTAQLDEYLNLKSVRMGLGE